MPLPTVRLRLTLCKLLNFKKSKRETRRALTIEEQATFRDRIFLPEFVQYRKLLLLQYYFGLRPFELTDARFDGEFLIALNAKHKTSDGDKVYKKIPIPYQARVHIDVKEPIECNCALDTLNRVFKKDMQDKGLRNITYAKLMQPLVCNT